MRKVLILNLFVFLLILTGCYSSTLPENYLGSEADDYTYFDKEFEEVVNFFKNDFVGTYTATQGLTSMRLEIVSLTIDGELRAKFIFYEHPSNLGVPSGSYYIWGKYDFESQELDLNHSQWIVRPNNYSILYLQAVIDLDNFTIIGNLGSEEYNFSVEAK